MSEDIKKSSLDFLKELADKDLTIDKSALERESLRTPSLHNKWLRMLYDRKERLHVLEWKKKIIARDKWLYYTGKANAEVYKEKGAFHFKILKGDLNLFIEADEEIYKIDSMIARVKNELDYIQRTIEEINRRSFHITNAIKALKFMNGEL